MKRCVRSIIYFLEIINKKNRRDRSLFHRVARERARIASPSQDPRSLARCELVAIRHGQLHVLREVHEVVDSLLDGVHSKALHGKVVVRIRRAEEPVFEHDSRPVERLRDPAVDRRICQIRRVCCRERMLVSGHDTQRKPRNLGITCAHTRR